MVVVDWAIWNSSTRHDRPHLEVGDLFKAAALGAHHPRHPDGLADTPEADMSTKGAARPRLVREPWIGARVSVSRVRPRHSFVIDRMLRL
jgi:hypothetical protein